MSGNINDTNIEIINDQVTNLKNRLNEIKEKGERKEDWEDSLKREFRKLYKTSKTLFNYIYINYNTPTFNEDFFNRTINIMLSKINSIQRSEISQDNASSYIGGILAKKYIPQLK
jgi:hypothetical protein